MGIRGIVRDIISIILGFQIIAGAMSGNFTIDTTILVEAIILFLFGIWFLLERVGVLPKL